MEFVAKLLITYFGDAFGLVAKPILLQALVVVGKNYMGDIYLNISPNFP